MKIKTNLSIRVTSIILDTSILFYTVVKRKLYKQSKMLQGDHKNKAQAKKSLAKNMLKQRLQPLIMAS